MRSYFDSIMKDWFHFVLSNKRLLNFGFLYNFFSAFGQTFFISLFVPFWVTSFGITHTTFGTSYSLVTIASAIFLTIAGRYIDRMSLRRYGLWVFAGLFISLIILSQARSFVVLLIGLFLVRWFGQGMMTHTSATGIAKYFDETRGKALGFTSLGHPAGQFILPLALVPLIAAFGWRNALLVILLLAAIVIIPSTWTISPVARFTPIEKKKKGEGPVTENYFATAKFWLIAVNVFMIPFLTTAVFLYQYSIAESKGWDPVWVTFSFAFYAVSSAITLLISGSLTDKYSGIRLFPLYLMPTIVGLVTMALFDSQWVFPFFYATMGISAGMGSTVKTAMQVEVYGKGSIGKIRSYFSTLLVFSTALGPPAFGYFIDRNISFDWILGVSAVLFAIVAVMSFRVWKYKPATD